MKKIMIFAAVACALSAEAKKEESYLFTYFTGNAPEQEQIHYALSSDGWNYTPLNDGAPVILSDTIALKKCVRDPHILRGNDGWFYQVITDMRCWDGWRPRCWRGNSGWCRAGKPAPPRWWKA